MSWRGRYIGAVPLMGKGMWETLHTTIDPEAEYTARTLKTTHLKQLDPHLT